MVLRLKTRESRSLPGLLNATIYLLINKICTNNKAANAAYSHSNIAGWSSPVARQAHNLKAAGSNPAPATKTYKLHQRLTKAPVHQPGASRFLRSSRGRVSVLKRAGFAGGPNS